MMKRIFIGIRIKPGKRFLDLFDLLKSGLAREKVKWTNIENIHVTIAFLGNTEEDRISALDNILKETCRGGSFTLELKGVGLFKNLRDPRIIWFGIVKSEQLINLNSAIVKGLIENGFPVEERAFSPHLTLGRVRSIQDMENLKKLIGNYNDFEIQKTVVSQVILYESITRKDGPVYKALGAYDL